MANKPLRPCAQTGCPELTRETWCAKHKPPEKTSRRDSAAWNYLYKTKWWLETRTEQLLKEPFCRTCAVSGKRVKATVADHIKPHRGNLRLFYDKTNLQSQCQSCHSKKTKEEEAARHS